MNLVRIQFELPEDKVRELEELMQEAGIGTKKDLLNNALTLFEWAIKEKRYGKMIASIDEEQNKLKELVMPSLSFAAQSKGKNVNENSKSISHQSELEIAA